MSRPAVRSLSLAVVLLAAALFSLWLQGREKSAPQVPGYTFVADLETWQATPQEREVVAAFDLRLGADWGQIPLRLGEWTGEDVPQDNLEVYLLLQPEQYLFRQYRRGDGALLWLSLLGSREVRSFHPPQICYTADGWRTEMQSEQVPLGQGELWAMHLLARKGDVWHSVLYFYLWPSRERAPGEGTILFKVTAPVSSGSPEAVAKALAAQRAFLRALFLAGR
ncbi:MAG: exosortase-associated EpsI family protein [Anaerolineae bacterium]